MLILFFYQSAEDLKPSLTAQGCAEILLRIQTGNIIFVSQTVTDSLTNPQNSLGLHIYRVATFIIMIEHHLCDSFFSLICVTGHHQRTRGAVATESEKNSLFSLNGNFCHKLFRAIFQKGLVFHT